jgi:hypothetical protein
VHNARKLIRCWEQKGCTQLNFSNHSDLHLSHICLKLSTVLKIGLILCDIYKRKCQLYYTIWSHQPNIGPDKKILFKNNYLIRSHKGHYGMRHTALWSCTHIRNIIDLSGKTKKLWSGQASLKRSRRSGRKNHTKTICLPSFEGET